MNYNYTLDAHLDLGGIILNRRRKGQTHILERLLLEDFKVAKLKVVVAAIFIETDRLEMALTESLLQIQAIKDDINESNHFTLITSKTDLEQVMDSDKIGIMMSLEGLEPIGRHLTLLHTFYDLGIRAVGLTWSRRNFVADGSYFRTPREGIKGGLTPFGIEVIEQAETLGLILDISHLNDTGFEDIVHYTKQPFIASHSNARSLNAIVRNLTDKQIRDISDRGGVIGVNAYTFIVDELDHSIERLCDHIEHLIKIGGENCVGFGFDFFNMYYDDGKSHDVLSYKEIDNIETILIDRGYSSSVIQKIFGENFLNLLMGYLT